MAKKEDPILERKLSAKDQDQIPAGIKVFHQGDRVIYKDTATGRSIRAVEFSNKPGYLRDILTKWQSDCKFEAEKEKACPTPAEPKKVVDEDEVGEQTDAGGARQAAEDATVTKRDSVDPQVAAREKQYEELNAMKFNDLKTMCKDLGTGWTPGETKEQLVAKIMGVKVKVNA